jgi:hypothetical protein
MKPYGTKTQDNTNINYEDAVFWDAVFWDAVHVVL